MGRQLGFRLPPPADDPGFVLWQLANAWQRRQREALADLGLTPVQHLLLATLWALDQAGERVSQRRLAEEARTDPMMTSQVVRTLEDRGLVGRDGDPADARVRVLTPTPAGVKLLVQAQARVKEADRLFFGSLGRQGRSLESLLRTLAGKLR